MKRNLLTILILALLVVNIGLTSVMMISVMGTNKKTAALVTDIATVMNLELTKVGGEEVDTTISLADTAFYDISSALTIALKPEVTPEGEVGKQSYILFSVAFSLDKTSEDFTTYGEGDLSAYESELKGIITEVVGKHTLAECQQDMDSIKEEILEEVHLLFQSDFIYKISVSDVKFG